MVNRSETSTTPGFSSALATQVRVIEATLIREMHTRFGRENIGYLWVIVEPLLLASGVSVIHLVSHAALPSGIQVVPFYITGYVPYMLFRSNVNRSAATIPANRALLYHRQITLFDLVFSRCLLELLSVMAAMLILLLLAKVLGLGGLPGRPLLMFLGFGLMFWFTLGLAMIIAAACEASVTVERLVHPTTYLILPISGMFFMLSWIPAQWRAAIVWFPLPQILDLIRMGQFENVDSPYVNLGYLVSWCAVLTVVGIVALRVIRRRMHHV